MPRRGFIGRQKVSTDEPSFTEEAAQPEELQAGVGDPDITALNLAAGLPPGTQWTVYPAGLRVRRADPWVPYGNHRRT